MSVINRKSKNKVVSLLDNNGVTITDHKEILSHTLNYFQQIYTTRHTNSKTPYATI